jgi:hypothetical protein
MTSPTSPSAWQLTVCTIRVERMPSPNPNRHVAPRAKDRLIAPDRL